MLSRFALTLALLLITVTLARAETYTIKMATVAPEGSPWDDSLKRVKQRWENQSGGRIKVRVFLGGKRGDENQTVGETKRGEIQMVGASTGAIASLVPELNVLELPYLFQSVDEADYILDKVIYDEMVQIFRDRGFELILWSENGFRNFGTNFGPVKKPADLKGHKMRSQENPIHLAMYRTLGALPDPIPTTETLSSLQNRVVDGYDQTALYATAIGLQKQTKYWLVSDHIYQPAAIIMNKAYFDKLPKDLQDVIKSGLDQETRDSRAGIRALTPLLLDNLKAEQIVVSTLAPAERTEWIKATKPVYDEYLKSAPPRAKALYEKIVAALLKYRAGKK